MALALSVSLHFIIPISLLYTRLAQTSVPHSLALELLDTLSLSLSPPPSPPPPSLFLLSSSSLAPSLPCLPPTHSSLPFFPLKQCHSSACVCASALLFCLRPHFFFSGLLLFFYFTSPLPPRVLALSYFTSLLLFLSPSASLHPLTLSFSTPPPSPPPYSFLSLSSCSLHSARLRLFPR